jgi:hypothetical protein
MYDTVPQTGSAHLLKTGFLFNSEEGIIRERHSDRDRERENNEKLAV